MRSTSGDGEKCTDWSSGLKIKLRELATVLHEVYWGGLLTVEIGRMVAPFTELKKNKGRKKEQV